MTGGVEVRRSSSATLRAWLLWGMWLLLGAAVVGSLSLHGNGRSVVVDGLGLLAVWMSAWVCWLAVWRVGFRRWEVLLSAAAVTSFAAGLTYLGAVFAGGGPLPLVSPADVAYLWFYPLMLAALFVAVHRSRSDTALLVLSTSQACSL